MKYDFTSLMDRRNMDAIAVDLPGTPGFSITAPKEGFDVIPMWVADMNFPTVPTISEAIIARTQHTAYGYFSPREEYFDAIIRWQKDRNGVEDLESKHIGYANGVLGGVVAAANILCSRGDNILVHSPTYVLSMYALIGAYKPEGHEWLEELRQEKKLSQEQLAEQLHVTRQAVSNWENGKRSGITVAFCV